MTTIVNTPAASDNSSGPITLMIILVVLVVIGYLAYAYGLPAIKQIQPGSPQINVPSQIDVNVHQTE